MLSFNSILDNETDKSSNKALNYCKNLLKIQTFADPWHPQGQEKKKKGKKKTEISFKSLKNRSFMAKEKVETNADKQRIPNGLTCPEKQ